MDGLIPGLIQVATDVGRHCTSTRGNVLRCCSAWPLLDLQKVTRFRNRLGPRSNIDFPDYEIILLYILDYEFSSIGEDSEVDPLYLFTPGGPLTFVNQSGLHYSYRERFKEAQAHFRAKLPAIAESMKQGVYEIGTHGGGYKREISNCINQ